MGQQWFPAGRPSRVERPRTVTTGLMKAVGVTEYGGPEVLHLIELPRPNAGAGKVRIRVHAATVNPGDTLLRAGDLDEAFASGPLTPPYNPGMEAAGVVDGSDQVSDLVADRRPGDGDRHAIDESGGAYAEYIVVDADQDVCACRYHAREAVTLPITGSPLALL